MLEEIKRYELAPNITKEILLENGFKEGGSQSDIPEPKISYSCVLHGDIDLHIEIHTPNDKKIEFDDFNNILIYDEEAGQPYFPFYNDIQFKFLLKIINRYNKKMDQLVDQGIFIEKEKNKQKIKTI